MNQQLNKDQFSEMVEKRKAETGESYLTVASELMEELGIEPEETVTILSRTLIEKIQADALKCNMLKEKSRTVNLIDME